MGFCEMGFGETGFGETGQNRIYQYFQINPVYEFKLRTKRIISKKNHNTITCKQ